jgi:hypothetical protein
MEIISINVLCLEGVNPHMLTPFAYNGKDA